MFPKRLLLLLALGGCRPQDVENARLTGTVTDRRTHQPVKGAILRVESSYYKGGDYDSYNKTQYTTLTTDAQGRFTAAFPLLCYLAITVKRAPKDTVVYAEEIFSRTVRVDVQL